MKHYFVVLRQRNLIRVLICVCVILSLFFLVCHRDRQFADVQDKPVWKTEPQAPEDINDPPFRQLPRPTKILPVHEVMAVGANIHLQFAYNNPDWKRQAYKSYWHSSVARWSYVPNLIHHAMHKIFVTYPTASVYYDFIHDLGIAEESREFQIPANNPYDNIVLVVMQTKVEKAVTIGNQVVIIGRPALTGLQVLLIPTGDLKPYNPKESILFQLVTNEGDEMDIVNEIYIPDQDTESQ